MTDKEALAAIEKEMGCMSEDPGRCCRTTCPSCRHFVDPEKFFDALAVAAKALREKVEAEKTEPLTWDELEKMSYQPVWITYLDGECVGAWALLGIVGSVGLYYDDSDSHDNYVERETYGTEVVAYRRPPAMEVK